MTDDRVRVESMELPTVIRSLEECQRRIDAVRLCEALSSAHAAFGIDHGRGDDITIIARRIADDFVDRVFPSRENEKALLDALKRGAGYVKIGPDSANSTVPLKARRADMRALFDLTKLR